MLMYCKVNDYEEFSRVFNLPYKEDFKLKGDIKGNIYQISSNGVLVFINLRYEAIEISKFIEILLSISKDIDSLKSYVVKVPQIPTYGSIYYSPYMYEGILDVESNVWKTTFKDLTLFYCGLCYDTREKASLNKTSDYMKLLKFYNNKGG